MPITFPWSASPTVSTTEVSLVTGTTTPASDTNIGNYAVRVDLNALAVGDLFELRCYEKATSGGTQRLVDSWALAVGGKPIFVSPYFGLGLGFDWRLVKLTGTDRAIPYSVIKSA